MTTGPLGQGIANSVGMAIARKWLADHYNRPGFELFDYNMYVVCGDGCLMEGVGSEAASLAAHLGLDDLCWIYDNNHITLDAPRALRSPRTSRCDSSWLWLECAAGRRRQRYRAHRARASGISPDQGAADTDYSRQPYRFRLAAQS